MTINCAACKDPINLQREVSVSWGGKDYHPECINITPMVTPRNSFDPVGPDRPRHLVDIDDIKPGREVLFECPVIGCTHHFWHVWQPSSAVSTFGVQHCRMHSGLTVDMIITAVK